MIKRILVLFIACIVLVSSLGVPASANELYESTWYDLLEYDSVTDTSNFFSYSTNYNVVLDLPVTQNLYYIDAVVSASVAPTVNVVGSSLTALNVKQVGTSKLYRVYGSLPSGNYSSLTLQFVGSGSTNYCTLLACNVSSSSVLNYPEIGGLWASPSDTTSVVKPSSVSSTVSVTLSNTTDASQKMLTNYRANIYAYSWWEFDFVDLYFNVNAYSIDSIEAHFDNMFVPYDITYLDTDSNPEADNNPDETYGTLYAPKNYQVLMRLDLRGLDRNSNYIPVVSIRGTYYNGHATNKITLNSYTGYVCTNNLNPVTVFLKRIWSTLETGFSDTIAKIGSAATSIVGSVTTLKNTFTQYIEEQWNKFGNWFTTQFEKLDDISVLLNTLVLGRSDQWNNADNFEDDVATQETQIDDMIDVIETAPTVPLGDVQSQVGQMSDVLRDADYKYYEILAASINGNQQISSVLFASFIFATIGFLLFGKR